MVALPGLYESRGTSCGAKQPTRAPDAATAEGGVAVGERLPNLQKCELSLFRAREFLILLWNK